MRSGRTRRHIFWFFVCLSVCRIHAHTHVRTHVRIASPHHNTTTTITTSKTNWNQMRTDNIIKSTNDDCVKLKKYYRHNYLAVPFLLSAPYCIWMNAFESDVNICWSHLRGQKRREKITTKIVYWCFVVAHIIISTIINPSVRLISNGIHYRYTSIARINDAERNGHMLVAFCICHESTLSHNSQFHVKTYYTWKLATRKNTSNKSTNPEPTARGTAATDEVDGEGYYRMSIECVCDFDIFWGICSRR